MPTQRDSVFATLFHDARRDARQALQQMRRSPGAAMLVIMTLALGIGANTTLATVIDGVLLEPPPGVRDAQGLGRILFLTSQRGSRPAVSATTSYSTFVLFRREVTAFADVAAYSSFSLSLGVGPEAADIRATLVSPAFFTMLGVTPFAGRLFETTDGFPSGTAAGGPELVVLGFDFWMRQFAGDRAILGRSIRIGSRQYVVVGIAPPGFRGIQDRAPDVWLPISVAGEAEAPALWYGGGASTWVTLIARLKASTTRDQAALESTRVWRRENASVVVSDSSDRVVLAPPIPGSGPDMPRELRIVLWLGGVSVLVLLIACANVTNLLLARGLQRRREIAVRVALGASGERIARQLFVETLMLVGLGGLAAYWIAVLSAPPLARLAGLDPMLGSHLWARISITAGIVLSCAVLVSFLPVVEAMALDVRRGLQLAGVGSRHSARWRNGLLSLQAMLCVLLLIGAGLFARSLNRVDALDLGVDLEHTVMAQFDFSGLVLPRGEIDELYRDMLYRVRDLPGVVGAALVDKNPYRNGRAVAAHTLDRTASTFWHAGVDEVPMEAAVDAGFFHTVGAGLIGRDFDTRDDASAPQVAIINEPLAKLLWPHRVALGQCMLISWQDSDRNCVRIVGIVRGFWRRTILDRNKLLVYIPLAQGPAIRPSGMFIRTRGDIDVVMPSIRRAVQATSRNLPAAKVISLEEMIAPEMRPWRTAAMMFALFGAVALSIAIVGLYGITAFIASQRRYELSLRAALGAGVSDMVVNVAGDALVAVGIGLAAGVATALVASRTLAQLLFQTSPNDPVAFFGSALVLLLVAGLAMIRPVITAMRADPGVVLRAEY